MSSTWQRTVGVVLIALTLSPLLLAQSPNTVPQAPVPSQIITAKRVFVSNTSSDGVSAGYFWKIGGPQRPYDEFYAAMKNWGRYELVSAPADADLVFEIRFGEPVGILGAPCVISILDAKTHFTLWTLVEPMQGALRTKTWEKNFTQGMTKIVEDLKKLSAQPTASAENPQK
jgi:hypothetical protein